MILTRRSMLGSVCPMKHALSYGELDREIKGILDRGILSLQDEERARCAGQKDRYIRLP